MPRYEVFPLSICFSEYTHDQKNGQPHLVTAFKYLLIFNEGRNHEDVVLSIAFSSISLHLLSTVVDKVY